MTSFASALVACIGVIAAGYAAGRLKIIDTTGAVPRLTDAAVSDLECGEACPIK